MLPRHILPAWLLLALLLPCSASADDARADAMTKQLETNRQRYGIAGQAVLVARNGQVLFRGADGEADIATHTPVIETTVFPVYSLAKLFASTLAVQRIEQGALTLDGPIGATLPGLPAHWQGIRLRDLLDHTSGLPEYFEAPQNGTLAAPLPADARAVFAALAQTPLQFAPGTRTRYTQTNYLVLAALLAADGGKPYPQLVEDRILRPLQLRHTWLGPAALPKHGVATAYTGRNGQLMPDPDLAWPDDALGHAALYTTLDDLARFLQAMTDGELVGRATLQALWQPRTLPDGQRGWFAAGWEYGDNGIDRQVGHDGGTRVRVRVLFAGSLDGDVDTVVYLTNGSARNVWSRTLVDSILAAMAPERFPAEALAETLRSLALDTGQDDDLRARARAIRAASPLDDIAFERTVNATGYAVRENFGIDPALRVFALNADLFPMSANAWDSLAEAYAAKGDDVQANALYEKARALARDATRRKD